MTAVVPATPDPPVEVPAATPVSEPTPAQAEPTVAPTAAATPDADPPPDFRGIPPERRRALMNMPRRERLAAIAELRRRALEAPTTQPYVAPPPVENRPAPSRPARTKINLEVEASQPSTGAQISALYAQVIIDDRPVRDFVIRFSGGNSFARWKKVQNIEIDDVPLNAREITLAVATDPGLNEERMEGSTRLSLEGQETSLSVVVRFYNQYDKSVRFR